MYITSNVDFAVNFADFAENFADFADFLYRDAD
jgi:hypothetical protein